MSAPRSYFQVSMAIARDPRLVSAIAAAGESAVCLWLFALAWSRSELTDGIVPSAMLPVIHPLSSKPIAKVADALVAVGLWRRREDGAYEIAGFSDWNPAKAAVEKGLADDRERKRLAVEEKRKAAAAAKDSNRNPPGIQEGATRTKEVERREERGERREEIKPQQPPPAGVRSHEDPAAAAILAELAKVPALADVATDATAGVLVAHVHTGTKKLEWILTAIQQAGAEATVAAGSKQGPMTDLHVGRLLRRFVENARAPKLETPKPGETLTPDQVQAIQARRGVQQGSAGPALDGNAMVAAILANPGVPLDSLFPGQGGGKAGVSAGDLSHPSGAGANAHQGAIAGQGGGR